MRPRPDFVIIGAQKSGSTALMRMLAEHPELYLPDAETRFFRDPWFLFEPRTVLEDAVAPAGPGVRRRGIKCPDYLADPAAPARILENLDDVSLIATLREPVSRAVSAYYWGMQWGWLPLLPPDEGISRLLDGTFPADYPRAREVLEYGRYGEQVNRYLELFPADRLHVVFDFQFRDDPAATMRGLCEFLGVDPAHSPPPQRVVNAGVYSFPRLRFLSLRHRWILREFPGHPGTRYLQPAKGVVGTTVNRGVSVVDRLVLARVMDNPRPELASDVRDRLAEYYRDDTALLERTLGCDLARWRTTDGRGARGRS